MASHYYSGSPGYSPYNLHHGSGQWDPQSPQFHHDSSLGKPPLSTRPSKTSLQPLIHDYAPNPPYYTQQSPRFSKLLNPILNWWLCILSLLVGAASISAITILLIFIDDQIIPKLPLNIAVNTYISFFATMAKASMLVAVAESISQLKWLWFRRPRTLHDIQIFDDASRGPMGALRLILRMRGVKLAALGGLVTVLSVVMEPFAQQVVAYRQREVEIGRASVGRAMAYDAGLELNTLESGVIVGPEWGMKAAIYDGIFKPKSVQDLTPVCPSANCTFPLFDSLAFCSKCLDVTQNVATNNEPSYLSSLNGVQQVSYSIPGGGLVEFSVLFEEGNLAIGPSIVSTTGLPADLSKQVLNVQDPLLTFAVLQFPDVRPQIKDGNYYRPLPITHECALYFCVNTYNVSVVNSVTNTTVVSSWTSDTGTPTVGGALQPGAMEGTFDAVLEPPEDSTNGNHTYHIPAGSLANLKAWLNVSLQGSMNTSFSRVDRRQWVNDEIQALNGTSDWSFLMAALAKAMTTYIRSASNPEVVTEVEGVAYQMETYIHVQWIWLGLPAGLVGVSVVFLAATIAMSESKRALAWKSSSLALLFHGLEGVGRGAGEGLDQMRAVARRTKVILTRGEDGEWKLITTE